MPTIGTVRTHVPIHREYRTERVKRAGNESERVAPGGERGWPGAWPALCRPLPSFTEVLQETSKPLRHSQRLVGHQAMFATQIFSFRQRTYLIRFTSDFFFSFLSSLVLAPVGVSSMGWGLELRRSFCFLFGFVSACLIAAEEAGRRLPTTTLLLQVPRGSLYFFLRLQLAKYVAGEREDSDFLYFGLPSWRPWCSEFLLYEFCQDSRNSLRKRGGFGC